MYRTTGRRSDTPDTVVVCNACGARAEVVFEEKRVEVYTCGRCATEQPVLRGLMDFSRGPVVFVSLVASDTYDSLSAFMDSLGVPGKASQVTVECEGIAILVSISLNSGTVMGIEMAAHSPGLPDMKLVPESHSHREAKSKGIIREAQTGDPSFDGAVYIESAVREEDVRTVLAAPAVRAALAKLLGAAGAVRIENGYVKIEIPTASSAFSPTAIYERLHCLRAIAGATRPILAEHVPLPRAAAAAKTLTYLFGPAALAVAIYGANAYGPINARPYFIGIAAGFVFAAVCQPFLTRALRGRSTSHRDLIVARLISFFFSPFLVTGLLFIANGALDRSTERIVDMKVVSTSTDNDDASKIGVTAKDDAGESHTYTFDAPTLPAPGRVRARWKAGALGWTWKTGPAIWTD